MESPLAASAGQLNLTGGMVLAAAGVLMAYWTVGNRVNVLMFILVLAAALAGTALPIVSAVAPLLRWVAVILLLCSGLAFSRIRVPVPVLLFWGYVFLGFVSLFSAISLGWQFQRAVVLLLVALAIPIAYGSRSYGAYYSTLVLIGLSGTLFALLNMISLPGQLNDPGRSLGYSKTAPALAVVLGGLLPFTLWGLWQARPNAIRILMGLGLLAGTVTLLLSGQRAGTVAGVIGVIPLLLLMTTRKRYAGRSLVLLALLFAGGVFLILQASPEKVSFLASRYSLDYGLSNRDLIWGTAYSEISRSPLLGRGIGASEWIISSSFHNAYLEVWFNTGIAGLLLFVGAQSYFLGRIFYLSRGAAGGKARPVLALALGYMLGFATLCLFESIGAGASNVNLILYLFLGVLISGDALIRWKQT
jgi:hypothetical protein